jgi:tellurite methyltransferase
VQREIEGFHQDAEAHWVAELSCGHQQHVRHRPPFELRPWVLSIEGRTERLGQTLDCLLCAQRVMPEGYSAYKRTPTFMESSIPTGLSRTHSTKRGVWAQIVVTRGALQFFEREDDVARHIAVPGSPAIVPAELVHRVAPLGTVEFHVEFWSASRSRSRSR